MHVKNYSWPVKKLHELRSKIDPAPQYQRGAVWRRNDNQLLIDSILRGFDIPKIYLRNVETVGFKYEVADGQQRLRAIWEFLDDQYPLADNCPVSGCAGTTFSDLPASAMKQLQEYKLVTAVVYKASGSEIRELFVRLQRGMRLSQPEIRNAIPSQLGDVIRTIGATHSFWDNSPFARDRYKTDDLVAHAFLLELSAGNRDLKAPQLRDMYREYANGVDDKYAKRVSGILDVMDRMQSHRQKCISRKWGFVDVYWVLSEMLRNRKKPDPKRLADQFVAFEARRLSYVSRPEELGGKGAKRADRDLFKYIEAFKTTGGLADKVKERHRVLSSVLSATGK